MATEDTQIDVLPTPGPVFAYRAFRNFVWGSPETSPLRPTPLDKENILPNLHPADSPLKRKGQDAEVRLTPKRQKTVPVSPTKSILRNHNEATPRQALLRHVNVTFQDARRVASHELNSNPAISTITRPSSVHHIVAVKPKPNNMHNERTTDGSQDLKALSVSKTAVDLEMEAYKESTERELRKLLKYSQKMREQAKRSDEENANLRVMLEEARKENARLSQQLADRDRIDSLHKTSYRNSQKRSATTSEPVSTRTALSKPPPRQHQYKRDYGDDFISARQPKIHNIQSASVQDRSAKRKASAAAETHRENLNTTEQLNNVYLPDSSSPQTKRTIEMPLRPLENNARPRQAVPTAPKDSLVAERQARARERLRAKQQARLASSQIKKEDENKTETNRDEVIDWLNI